MKIIKTDMKYFEETVSIAFETYKNECTYTSLINNCSKDDIADAMKEAFQKKQGFMCLENGKLAGYLVYDGLWNDDGMLWCNIPLWGYGAEHENRAKIVSMLFQSLADKLFKEQKVHFEVKIYAHDKDIITLFSFMQFGIECEEDIRCISEKIKCSSNVNVMELDKAEIQNKWNEIWAILKKLVEHLQRSPVFYPGKEFTEDVYKEFLLDESTRLCAAEKEGQLIGIMTASKDGNSFINNNAAYFNIGDIYVEPEYRGKMIAQQMLKHFSEVLEKEGVKKLWVEHGTANPNARGFWNKYFTAYSYTMIREINTF